MHNVEMKDLSIEALAALRDDTIALLADKAEARQKELEAEIARVRGLNGGAPAPREKAPAKYRKGQNEWSGRARSQLGCKPTSMPAERWRI